jgi:pimeloyl-ACP methyl ester carboxylesterase
LARTPDTELPGRYGLFTTGTYGYVKLGAVLSADRSTVRRKLLTQIEAGARIDRDAAFSGWYYSSPSELHLPWQSVLIGTPAGPCPAWHFPAASSTWVIHVHGRGTTRAEGLRAVPVFHALGMPNLVVSYRNDGEGPRSRSGAYALGAAEWLDVDSAIAYALRHGATRVLLMGWSMGGAIVLQTAATSAHAEAIAGLILESPVVDWRTVLRFQARAARIRPPLPALAMSALSRPLTARLSGAEDAIPFDRLDMVARADELNAPILILHSEDDGFVPADGSHALAAARPDLVTMPRFTVARHTKLWNYDQNGWTRAITEWMTAQGFSASA